MKIVDGKVALQKIEWEKVNVDLAEVMNDFINSNDDLELNDSDGCIYRDFIIPTSVNSLLKLHLWNAQCCPIPTPDNSYLTRFVLYGKSHTKMEGRKIITGLEIRSIGSFTFQEIDKELRTIIDSYYTFINNSEENK